MFHNSRTLMAHFSGCYALILASTTTLVLAGCNSPVGSFQVSLVAQSNSKEAVSASASGRDGVLYVANAGSSVSVYSYGEDHFIRSITNGVSTPLVATSDTNKLYVSNYRADTVTTYSPSGKNLRRTISRNFHSPSAIAFDSKNTMYVANQKNIAVLPNANTVHMRRLHFYAISLTVDASDNLYAGGYSSVEVFSPNAKTPKLTINGTEDVRSIAVDASGYVYVASAEGGTNFCGLVMGYAPGATSPSITLGYAQGICNPERLLIGPDGNLYVLNESSEYGVKAGVAVYLPQSNSLLRTVTQGITYPADMTFDRAGNLYVANATSGGPINVYAPGSSTVLRSIKDHLDFPRSLTFAR
jgi:sugar lactone lactonase YvrE